MRRFLAAYLVLCVSACGPAYPTLARDAGQWAQIQPGESIEDKLARSAWFERQMMPDNPGVSCCGEADAYYADKVEVADDGKVFAIITDTRDDELLKRPHIDVGTKFEVPPWKNKDTRQVPNRTGHTIVFVGSGGVYCYLPSGDS